MNYSYQYNAEILKIIDGDTVDARVDLGFMVFKKERFRLARINAAEMTDPTPEGRARAIAAKAFLETYLVGKKLVVESKKTDIYGRYIGELTVANEKGQLINVSTLMLSMGLVEEYKGK